MEGESFDNYLTAVESLAKTCNFATLYDSLLRDCLVIGIRSNNTRKRLLQERQLDLFKCIDICRASETSERQMKAIDSEEKVQKLKDKPSVSVQKQTRAEKPLRKCKFCARALVLE